MVAAHKNTTIRQRQILDAAKKVIVKYGSENVTIKRIAKEVGISEGALYRHFRSKLEVLSLLVDDARNVLLADVERAYTGSFNSIDDLERIIMELMFGTIQRNGASFQVIAEIVSLGNKRLNDEVYKVIGEYTGRIKEILSAGVKAGVIRPTIDLDATAILFFSIAQGLASIWTLSHYDFDIEQRCKSLWDVFREGIVTR